MQAKDALLVVMLRGSDSQGLSSSSVPKLLTLRFITVELCSSSFGWHLMPLTYHPQAVTGGKASSPLLTDEREAVQKKTFTKWVNSHLARVSCRITDLYTDLRDGRMLIKLLEVLSGERLVRGVVGGGCEVILYHRWGNVFEKSSLGLSRADLCG